MTGDRDDAAGDETNGWIGERRVFVRSPRGVTSFRLTAGSQIALGLGASALLIWTGVATAMLTLDRLGAGGAAAQLEHAETAHRARLAELGAENAALAAKLAAQTNKLAALGDRLTAQQRALTINAKVERELAAALESAEARLGAAIGERDAALAAEAKLSQALGDRAARTKSLSDAREGLSETLAAVNAALADAVATRDDALADARDAAARMEEFEAEREAEAARRERMYAQLEEAVRYSLGEMEGVLERAGLDVDSLLASVQREYSGAGGPFIPVAASGAVGGADAVRVGALIDDLERINLTQIAAAKLPLSRPVRVAHRVTSGFGIRRDPKNGRARMHKGMDFAAATGTPIHSTGEGVVTFAGRQNGYGLVVKIRHSFGFETVYAHLNKIRIEAGERVARGDRIGDMGASGRTTGTHLHYEIRVNGEAINPSKYIEAARHVL